MTSTKRESDAHHHHHHCVRAWTTVLSRTRDDGSGRRGTERDTGADGRTDREGEGDDGGVRANRLHGTNDDANDGVFFNIVFNIVCALARTLLGSAPRM